MSKILLINGSPRSGGCTYTALLEVAAELERNGVETELIEIGKQPVAGCIACGRCRETGRCIFNDDAVNRISERLEEYDGIVVGSPVYYAGPSGQICAFLDRLFYSNGGRMEGKIGAAVVSCRRGGASSAFDRLNKYFQISNMVVASSQYWNQVHGNSPEEVRQDIEGMQTMRTLGKNIAWLAKSMKAAGENGVQPPAYEPKTFTNFIR